MTSFSTKWLITQKLLDFKGWCNWLFGSLCSYQPKFWYFIKFKHEEKMFYIFSLCNFLILHLSYMAGYPTFSHWFYHLCVIVKYSAKKNQTPVYEKYWRIYQFVCQYVLYAQLVFIYSLYSLMILFSSEIFIVCCCGGIIFWWLYQAR